MMKSLSLVPVLALAAVWGAQAQTQKIGVINMQEALVSTKDGQKALTDLRSKYSPKDQEFQKRQQEIQAKQDQLRKGQNTMSDQAKATLEREISSLQTSLQRDADDTKQDMDQDQQKVVNELGQKMIQVINKYATDNQFTMVFDVSGQPNNILFASSGTEITRDVVALYDKSAAVTPAAPPSKPATPPATSAPRPSGVTAAPPAAPPARRPATPPGPGK